MCGRYYRRSDKQHIAEAFRLGRLPEGFVLPDWDYNVAPTSFQPVIREERDTGERELVLMRWGLVPHFAKSLTDFKGISTINAKAESLQKSATWRTSFQRRRCLVPAEGFYEWQKADAKTKHPHAIGMADCGLFAFAGLWDAWKDPAHHTWLQSFSIVTTAANNLIATIHDRMPVIIKPKDHDRWLTRADDARPPLDLLRPHPAEQMKMWKVDSRVGNVRNNDEALLNVHHSTRVATVPM